MKKRGFLQRVPLEQARAQLLELSRPTGSETVPTEDAAGRITAAPVRARFAAPHYRASAMDGIAVRATDTTDAAPDRPRVLALRTSDEAATDEAACQPVDTGSPMPDWADAVVRIENTTELDGAYEIHTPVSVGQDVRQIGEDIVAGTVLFGHGHRIQAVDIGAMLATGISSIRVSRRPRIVTIATGDEIVEPGTDPAPGNVVEFNSRVLAAFARGWGADTAYFGSVGDDQDALVAALRRAVTEADIVCMIAGSSAGRKDLTVAVLAECGRVLVHGIDMMPGKPTAIAEVEGKPVIGLPGYPVSAAIVCQQLLRPLVAASLEAPCPDPETVEAEVRRQIPSKLGVEEFLRVCLSWDGRDFVVAPLPRGAGSISTLVRADAILRIGATSEGVDRGRRVVVELLRPAASVRRTVVVAGQPSMIAAALEEILRRAGHFLRLSHLGLSPHDAVTAMALGQAHVALFDGTSEEARKSLTTLSSRIGDRWKGARIGSGAKAMILVLSPSFIETDNGKFLVEALHDHAFLTELRSATGDEALVVNPLADGPKREVSDVS